MLDEITTFYANDTWQFIPFPPGKSLINCYWIEIIKVSHDDQVDCLKAHLITKGYNQFYGEDYCDTFSPITKMSFIHLLLSIAAMYSQPLFQLDIENASFYGELQEEIYME